MPILIGFEASQTVTKAFAETASTNNEGNRTIRSKTFPGIANAMAQQWGKLLIEQLC